jgi:hypothetical protein
VLQEQQQELHRRIGRRRSLEQLEPQPVQHHQTARRMLEQQVRLQTDHRPKLEQRVQRHRKDLPQQPERQRVLRKGCHPLLAWQHHRRDW